MAKQKFTRDELYNLYWGREMSTTQIANKVGVSNTTISNWLKKFNISRRKNSLKKFNLTRDELYDLYWGQGLSTFQIADKIGVNSNTIGYWLKKFNIPIRKCGGKKGHKGLKGSKHPNYRGKWGFKKGSKNLNWTGGKGHRPKKVYYPNHPYCYKSRCIFEHHKIFTEYFRRPIPKGYHIHHLNGDETDNRIENLICLQHSIHTKIHSLIRKSIITPLEVVDYLCFHGHKFIYQKIENSL